jgi:hypothetical protein
VAQCSRKIMILMMLVVVGISIIGCTTVDTAGTLQTQAPTPTPTPTENVEATPMPTPTAEPTPSPKPVVTRAGLSAIGDILIHNTVFQDAALPDGTYDFKPMFKKVKPILHEADVAIANQESIIGGSQLGLSSYPLFNSPHEVGNALLDTGISIVTNANNHTMDMGEKGILSASAFWNQIGMPYTGSFISQVDRDRIRTLTKNNITFSF